MACDCCASGSCCAAGTCSQDKKKACAEKGGVFTVGGSCSFTRACTYSNCKPCEVVDKCKCDHSGGQFSSVSSCDCDTLAAVGVSNGGCCVSSCETCVSGRCTSYCPSKCCNGDCCTEAERCAGGRCQPACGTGTTYCSGGNGSYSCCGPASKCCGSQGCKSTSGTANFNLDVTKNSWTDTGLTVNGSFSVTASGSAQWRNSPFKDYAPPTGVAGSFPTVSVDKRFLHFSVIGKIGSTIFGIGNSYSGSGSGKLEVRANDTNVVDNAGFFAIRAIAIVDPCPGAAAASLAPRIVAPPVPLGLPHPEAAAEVAPGPGVELKALLKLAGIVASPNCSCNARAAQMDAWGEYGCLVRISEITGWLKEEAAKRNLWFFPPAGVALILASISLSALKRLWKGIKQ